MEYEMVTDNIRPGGGIEFTVFGDSDSFVIRCIEGSVLVQIISGITVINQYELKDSALRYPLAAVTRIVVLADQNTGATVKY